MSDHAVSQTDATRAAPVTLDPVRFSHFLSLVPDALRVALLDQLGADLRQAAAEVAAAWTAPTDWDLLRRPCHSLVGLAGTIGADAVRAAAWTLGEAARARDLGRATAAQDRLIRAEAALLAEVGAARHRAAARA